MFLELVPWPSSILAGWHHLSQTQHQPVLCLCEWQPWRFRPTLNPPPPHTHFYASCEAAGTHRQCSKLSVAQEHYQEGSNPHTSAENAWTKKRFGKMEPHLHMAGKHWADNLTEHVWTLPCVCFHGNSSRAHQHSQRARAHHSGRIMQSQSLLHFPCVWNHLIPSL